MYVCVCVDLGLIGYWSYKLILHNTLEVEGVMGMDTFIQGNTFGSEAANNDFATKVTLRPYCWLRQTGNVGFGMM